MPDRRGLPSISVIVASHGRPADLGRCLTALGLQDYPFFEIVVVADRAGQDAVARHRLRDHVRLVGQEAPHLARARNAGVAAAAGDVVAFIDDDATAEPCWLTCHARTFRDTDAAASVGYVRGRNGISFQSRAASVDAEAETHEEPRPRGDGPFRPDLAAGRALKLVGTNFAIRRDVIGAIDGFDPAFPWYLDDSDLSLRLARAGHRAWVTPLAEVHHAFAASPRRTAQRAPRSLFDIGRSTAVYTRRHGTDQAEIRLRVEQREWRRLIGNMVRGTIEPRDVDRLMRTLDDGWFAGLSTVLPDHVPLTPDPGAAFRPVPMPQEGHTVLSSRLIGRRRALRRASDLAAEGRRVSVFSFSLTAARHHVRMTDDGIWLQTGGQFGRSRRDGPRPGWCRFADRLKEEISRVAKQRGI